MIKVLNIITSGIKRDGITISQIECLKHMDLKEMQIDIASVNNPEKGIIEEFKGIGCNVIQFPNRLNNMLKYMLSLNKQIKKEKYDVIHVHGSSALMAIELSIAKANHVRIRIAHSRNTTCRYRVLDKLLRPVFNRTYNYALACGEDAGEWLFPGKKFQVLHNGKDLRKFAYNENLRKAIREKLTINNEIAVGFVGSLNYQKNIPFILKVFHAYHKMCPNTKLFMMGEGPDRKEAERFIESNHLERHIFLTGRVSNINEILQGMDIMVLPSRYEGLPNVVLEWQICGLPSIISSKITKECVLTDFVHVESIDDGIDRWVEELIALSGEYRDRSKQSQTAMQRMKDEKFDIEDASAFLKKLYLKSL